MFALLTLLALAGCRNPAPGYTPTPPPPVEPTSTKEVRRSDDLMPLAVGNQWTYMLSMDTFVGAKNMGGGQMSVVYRVESIKPNGDAVMVLMQDGRILDRQGWRSNGKGLFQTSSGVNEYPYAPAQPIALLPLETGGRFSWKGKGVMSDGTIAWGTSTSEVLEPQKVDTTRGPISAIPVMSTTKFKTGKNVATSWFRPGLGLVRMRQETLTFVQDEKKNVKQKRDTMLLTLTNYALQQ